MAENEQVASAWDTHFRRRGLLRLGTLVASLTGASTISAVAAHGAPGDKIPLNAYVPTAEKGAPSGVATLDVGSRIPYSQLPDLPSVSPRAFGAKGDGESNDHAAVAATLAAADAGTVIDLGGRTFSLGQTLTIDKSVTVRNGTFKCAVDRVATVLAANVRLENVAFIRTGPASKNSAALALNAANCALVDVIASSSCGESLRMGNGTCNGTQIRGGEYSSSDTTEAITIHLLSGPAHNYDVKISKAVVRHTGYGSGIGLYNCSRTTVEHCDVRGIRRSPWFQVSGWVWVAGTVYRALDRTDVTSNAVFVNDIEYRKNADPASTAPALNYYTTPGDGYLYINTGIDPSGQTVKTTRTNGYGIMFYSTSSESLGMRDNLIAHNYVEDTDGFGIYYQTLMNVPRNNRTLQNTLRSVCRMGVAVGDLPFAGIGVFGGLDVQLDGDMIDGVGTKESPAPGIDFKASAGVPRLTGSIRGVSVLNATAHGISLCAGTWQLSDVSAQHNTGSGITHGNIIRPADILDATLTSCVASNNGLNGASFESVNGEIEVQVLGGRYTYNAVRNLNLVRCRNVFIGGGLLSGWAGNNGINVASSNQRVILDGVFLRAGVGLIVSAGIGDLTINNIISDGSAGTKFNVSGPYKTGGATGTGADWRCKGTPEGVIIAAVGSRCTRIDGGAGTTSYVKESGTGNTGWVAK